MTCTINVPPGLVPVGTIASVLIPTTVNPQGELLIGAGGNTALKSKDGLTALDIAHKYGHDAMARVLSRPTAGN